MDKKKRKNLINIISLFICSIVVIVILLKNDVVSVFNEIKNARWIFIFIAIVCQLLMPFIDGCILMTLSRRFRKDYTYKEGLTNELIGLLFCFITPSATGGQFAQVTVYNKQRIEPHKSLSILLIKFLAYQIISVLYGIFTLVLNKDYMSATLNTLNILGTEIEYTTLAYFGLFINILAGFGLFFLAYSRIINGIIRGIYKLLYKLNIIKDLDAALSKVENRIVTFKENLNDLKHMKKEFILILLLNILKFSFSFIIPYFVARALGINLDSSYISIMISLTCYLNLITTFIPIPGSSGGAELFFALLFVPLFGSETLTTSGMLIWRTITFYIPLLYTALVTLIYNRSSRMKVVDYVPNKNMWFFYHNFKQEYSLIKEDYSDNQEDADEGYY